MNGFSTGLGPNAINIVSQGTWSHSNKEQTMKRHLAPWPLLGIVLILLAAVLGYGAIYFLLSA